MGIKGRVAVTALFTGLSALGSIPPASATTRYTSYTVYANLDGDSARDRVTVSTAPGNQIRVQFKLDDGRYAERTMGLSGPVLHPKIHDIYDDGFDEVGVPIVVGANTTTYALYRYDPHQSAAYRVRAVRNGEGSARRIYEGGGAMERSEYACTSGSTPFEQITAEATNDNHWNITRKTYKVSQNSILYAGYRRYIHVSADHPLMHLDPTTCS